MTKCIVLGETVKEPKKNPIEFVQSIPNERLVKKSKARREM